MDKHFSISEIIKASDDILNTPSKSSKINNIKITKNNYSSPLLLVNEISKNASPKANMSFINNLNKNNININEKIKNEIINELYNLFKKKIIIFNLIRSILFYSIKAFKNYFKKKYDYININNNKQKEYSNIFISHFDNAYHQFTNKDDFYFKDMPSISSKNVNTLIVLINHTSLDVSNHLEKFTRNNYDILVLSNNLKYKDKIHIFINSLKIFFIIFSFN